MPVYQKLVRAFPISLMRGKPTRLTRCFQKVLLFTGGFALGQLYYFYLLKKIPFTGHIGVIMALAISLFLGVGNVVCAQLRCVSLLTLPMYCGKPGRGVLKVVALTYVIAGPITNMGLNAKEVVRVFACSTLLSQNLSDANREAMAASFQQAIYSMREEISEIKDTISSIRDVFTPIENEVEDELIGKFQENQFNRSPGKRRNRAIGHADFYRNHYIEILDERCKKQAACALAVCTDVFATVYQQCLLASPDISSWVLCSPMKLSRICNLEQVLRELNVCSSVEQINSGFGEGHVALKKAKAILANNRNVVVQYKVNTVREVYDFQDAMETSENVMHAFDEKYIVMNCVIAVVNIFVALLFLRIFSAAVSYHEEYLADIEYDNIYITELFKKIDRKRGKKGQLTLLPLKKMERNKYVGVHSLAYTWTDRNKLLTHILKLMLEVVTATTFVMLDRLFYEAMDVVRQHAETELSKEGTRDLEIKVEGTGTLTNMVRKVLTSLNSINRVGWPVHNKACLPRPRLIPFSYYVKIYGGYLWILFLLYIHPYTARLRSTVCSYFYPCREKQRTLHLYNDILKKRMKMQKTLRRNAVQAVRAHYLSGENLLSLRMKFPRLLGWLRALPAARMSCLICGETEPRDLDRSQENWHTCKMTKCPFVYCVECWREMGARCLACDPSLAELSDIDELSDDDFRQ